MDHQSSDTEDDEQQTQPLLETMEEERYATLESYYKEDDNERYATLESYYKEDDNERRVTMPTSDEEDEPKWVTMPTSDEEDQPLVESENSSSVSEANHQEAQPITKNVESGNQHEQPAKKDGVVTRFILSVDAFINHQDCSKFVALLNDLDEWEHPNLRMLLEPQEDTDESEYDTDESEDDSSDEEDYGVIPELDGADSDETNDAASTKKTKKKRTRAPGFQRRVEMTWELDNPDQSVAVPLRNGPQDLTDRTVAMLFTSPDYADYINEKNARVENPQAGDIYIFKEVNREDFKHVIKMDGYAWRAKGWRAPMKRSVYPYSDVYAATQVSEVYTSAFQKRCMLDETNNLMLIKYTGDPKYGEPSAVILGDVPRDRWYPEACAIHPTDAIGNVISKDKNGKITDRAKLYQECYDRKPEHLKMKPGMSGSNVVLPPIQPPPASGDEDSDGDGFALTQQEKDRTIKCPRPRGQERLPGELSPEESEEEEGEEDVDDPTGSQPSNLPKKKAGALTYGPATSFVQMRPTDTLDLKTVWQLKRKGDRMKARCEAENREPFYQSIVKTYITNPQPLEVYYRDLSKIPGHKRTTNYNFESKEARQDGYEWRRRTNHFLKQEWCTIYKSTYNYYNTETQKIDSTWAKNFYIFPKDDQMIIVYKGDNSVAVKRPHGNSAKEPAPDHYSRLPEVRAEAIEIAASQRGTTPAEAFRLMTGEERAGEGLQGIISVPKNIRAVKHNFATVAKALDYQHEHSVNIILANQIAGGNILRRSDILNQANQFIILAHDDAVREFKDICKNYRGDAPLMFHMDTSFNAGGKKSGFVITHLMMAHPYITRARSEAESGVNFPLVCLVHQRRTMPTINTMLAMADDLLELGKVTHPTFLVSDKEYGETTRLWNNAAKGYCWNHIRQDVERHAVNRHGVRKAVGQRISNQVFELLRCHDEQEYDQLKTEFFTQPDRGEDLWKDPAFQVYFDRYQDPVIRQYSGRWKLEEHGIPNPERGITNNRAESLNKSFNNLKMTNIRGGFPEVLLCFTDLQTSTIKEMRKAHFREGEMKLNTAYQDLVLPTSELPAINYKTYGEMLKQMRKTPGMMRLVDPAAPTPTKANENPAVAVFLAQIATEEAWYSNPANGVTHRVNDDLTFNIAKYGLKLHEASVRDIYITRFNPPDCSCPNGPICSHVFFCRKLANMEALPDEKEKLVKDLIRQQGSGRGRGRGKSKDYGTKQPRSDSYIDPTMMTPGTGSRRNLWGRAPSFASRGQSRTPSPAPSHAPSRSPSPFSRGRRGARTRFSSRTSESSRSPSPGAGSRPTELPTIFELPSSSSTSSSPSSTDSTDAAPTSVTSSHPISSAPTKRNHPATTDDDDDSTGATPSKKTLQASDDDVEDDSMAPTPSDSTAATPSKKTLRWSDDVVDGSVAPTTTDSTAPTPTKRTLPASDDVDDDSTAQTPTKLAKVAEVAPPSTVAKVATPSEVEKVAPPSTLAKSAPPATKKSLKSRVGKTVSKGLSMMGVAKFVTKSLDLPTHGVTERDVEKRLSKFAEVHPPVWWSAATPTMAPPTNAPPTMAPPTMAPPKSAPPRSAPPRRAPLKTAKTTSQATSERVQAGDRIPLYLKSNDSRVLTREGNIDLTEATTLTHELKKIQIDPQEARWVEVGGQKMALIKSLGRGGAVIFYNQLVSTSGEDLAFIAGTIIQEDAIVTNGGELVFRVSLRQSPDRDFIRKAEQGMVAQNLQLGVKQKEYRLVCTCCTPLISDAHVDKLGMDFVAQCACGELAHRQCLPKSVSEIVVKGGQYQCTPCIATELFEGVKWSEPVQTGFEQVINTCTIDNFLTSLAIFTHEQNCEIENFFPDDEQHKHLRDTMDLVRRKRFNQAQTKYYLECKDMNDEFAALPENRDQAKVIEESNKQRNAVIKKNTDIKKRNAKILEHNKKHPDAPKPLEVLEPVPQERWLNLPIPELLPNLDVFGEAFERVNSKHKAGFEVGLLNRCSNPACGKHLTTLYEYNQIGLGHYLNAPHDFNGIEDLEKMTTKNLTHSCVACQLQGVITQEDFVIQDTHWALSFDATSMMEHLRKQAKIDILNGKLPDTITIKNTSGESHVYGLASVTLQEQNHFVSALYLPSRGEFVFYDGIPATRIRKLHSSDIMDEGRTLYSLDYFRLK